MSAKLNYKVEGQGKPIVLIHGLFGNLDNLGLLARDLKNDHQVISIDLRNHGESFHSEQHDYPLMAQDVAACLAQLKIEPAVIIGHSMGGKVAMQLSQQIPEKIQQLIVLDMAPIAYTIRRHDNVFAGLFAVLEQQPSSRQQAMKILEQHIELEGVRQFLSKSLYKQANHLTWRFNVQSLYNNYNSILGWQPIPASDIATLFIKGGNSEYIQSEYQADIVRQFPKAKAHIIANTGHWLHAEKPTEVLRAIRKFITAG